MTIADKSFFEQLGGAATAFFALGIVVGRWERRARKWPQAEGTITVSRFERQAAGRAGQVQYVPIIEYQFEYEGKVFTSSHRKTANYSTGSGESCNAVLDRYPAGATIKVFVNWRNPVKSMLECGMTALSWIPIGFGIFLALLTLATLKTG